MTHDTLIINNSTTEHYPKIVGLVYSKGTDARDIHIKLVRCFAIYYGHLQRVNHLGM